MVNFISTPQHNLLILLSPSFLPVSQTLSCHKPLIYDYFSSPAGLRTTMHRYAKLHCEVACIISVLNALIVLHPLYGTAITILFWLIDNASTSCLCALLHDWQFVLLLAFLSLLYHAIPSYSTLILPSFIFCCANAERLCNKSGLLLAK